MTDQLLNKLKNLMLLCPDYAYDFLYNFALEKPAKILETLIASNDKQPRQIIANMLAISVNLVINYEGFEMDIFKLN